MGSEMYEFNRDFAAGKSDSNLSRFAASTFLWMFLGLALTFAVALYGYASGRVLQVFSIPFGHILLLIAELVVVFFLSARIRKISVPTARILFFVYSALNGVVFSTYFLLFEVSSIILVFGAAALYFAAVAAYGWVTKSDMCRLRPILFAGLVVLLVFAVLSLFLPLGNFDRIACFIGVAIFMGLTAYDVQKIKHFYLAYQDDKRMLQRVSIYAAVQLYLDFINLFVYLLRILGKHKD